MWVSMIQAIPFSDAFRTNERALLGPQASSPANVRLEVPSGLQVAGEDACGPRRARPLVRKTPLKGNDNLRTTFDPYFFRL
jgi:hypothetical protein